jgi:hypothetical protein
MSESTRSRAGSIIRNKLLTKTKISKNTFQTENGCTSVRFSYGENLYEARKSVHTNQSVGVAYLRSW